MDPHEADHRHDDPASLVATNRPLYEDYLRAKRARGVKESSIEICKLAFRRLENLYPGVPVKELTPDQLRSALEEWSRTLSPTTVSLYASAIRTFYNWLYDDEMPPAIRKSLRRIGKTQRRVRSVVTPSEFRELLETVGETLDRDFVLRFQALLWILYDGGFRISEALSLRVGDVHEADKDGVRLVLPEDAPDLKTGPRTVYVVESVPALKAWLAAHPNRKDPRAPLFPAARSPHKALRPGTVVQYMRRLAKRTSRRYINPHLLRHTRATRAAEAGWNESQLCRYFGWTPGSRMASYYVHLSQSNVEERVRRDAGADPIGARVPAPAPATVPAATPVASSVQDTAELLGATVEALLKRGLLKSG